MYSMMKTQNCMPMLLGGHKAVTGGKCILEFFLKKLGQSLTAVLNYHFLLVLEVSVYLLSAFCELADEHCLIEQNRSLVSRFSTQQFAFLTCCLQTILTDCLWNQGLLSELSTQTCSTMCSMIPLP